MAEQCIVSADDLAHDNRWPRFAKSAADRGVRLSITDLNLEHYTSREQDMSASTAIREMSVSATG